MQSKRATIKLKIGWATDEVDIYAWMAERSSTVTCHDTLGTDDHWVFKDKVYCKALVHLQKHTLQLLTLTTTTHSFNARFNKICAKYRLLRTCMLCRPWLHGNIIISEAHCSSWMLSDMFNVAEIILCQFQPLLRAKQHAWNYFKIILLPPFMYWHAIILKLLATRNQ